MVGCGGAATAYYMPCMLRHKDDYEMVAVCDINRRRTELCARPFGVPRIYTDYYDMITKADIEAVFIHPIPKGLTYGWYSNKPRGVRQKKLKAALAPKPAQVGNMNPAGSTCRFSCPFSNAASCGKRPTSAHRRKPRLPIPSPGN